MEVDGSALGISFSRYMKTAIVVGGTDGSGSAPSDQAVPHGALFDMSPTYFNSTYTLAKK